MNKTYWLGALGVLALVATAGLYPWRSNDTGPDQTGVSRSTPKDAVKLETMPAVSAGGVQWEADDDTSAPPAVDAASARTSEASGNASYDDSATEIVLGVEVKKDRDCTVSIAAYRTLDDGTQSPVYRCVPNQPKPQDPYDSYSNEALENLAYSDADAAMLLATRYVGSNYNKAVDYGVRSAALSGQTLALKKLLMHLPQNMSNQEKFLATLKRRYILSGVIQSLDANSTEHQKNTALASAYKGDGFDVARLEAEISAHVANMQAIRAEVGID